MRRSLASAVTLQPAMQPSNSNILICLVLLILMLLLGFSHSHGFSSNLVAMGLDIDSLTALSIILSSDVVLVLE